MGTLQRNLIPCLEECWERPSTEKEPLMQMTSERIDYLYDLMDSAYDAKPIYEVSRSLGHVHRIARTPSIPAIKSRRWG
jgi:hypothetical protein